MHENNEGFLTSFTTYSCILSETHNKIMHLPLHITGNIPLQLKFASMISQGW